MLRARIVVVVFVERPDVIRIISLRKALTHEREKYKENLQDRLGQS
jgi:hypothetical protein